MEGKLICVYVAACFASIFMRIPMTEANILYAAAAADIHGINSEASLGIFYFDQYVDDDGKTPHAVDLSTMLTGIYPEGDHGFHIHENADDIACELIGHHINPFHVYHGKPSNDVMHRHIGDLGNLYADSEGIMTDGGYDTIIQVGTGNATFDIVGRSVAIHATFDDFGVGAADPVNTMGNAGPMVACGTIRLISSLVKYINISISLDSDYGNSIGSLRVLQYQNASSSEPLYLTISGQLNVTTVANATVGFFINEKGTNVASKCSAAGNPYNPSGSSGAPDGLLGYTRIGREGRVSASFTNNELHLGSGDNANDVLGRSVVVYIVDDSFIMPGNSTNAFDPSKAQLLACGNITA